MKFRIIFAQLNCKHSLEYKKPYGVMGKIICRANYFWVFYVLQKGFIVLSLNNDNLTN